MKTNTSRLILSIILLFGFATGSYAKKRSIKAVFQELSSIKDPFDLRDPFKPPYERKKISFSHSTKSNLVLSAAEILKHVNVEDIRVVGVMVGKERRAVLKIGEGKETLVAKEGMVIGEESAELKAILPGGIVLVEKIRNIYDDDEYIETIIPLSDN